MEHKIRINGIVIDSLQKIRSDTDVIDCGESHVLFYTGLAGTNMLVSYKCYQLAVF